MSNTKTDRKNWEADEFFRKLDVLSQKELSDPSDPIWYRWPRKRHITNSREYALELWTPNHGLAYHATKQISLFVRRYKPTLVDSDDYKQIALMGLWSAALTYDVTKGAQFSTWSHIVCRHFTSRAIDKSLRHTVGSWTKDPEGLLHLLVDTDAMEPFRRLELQEVWEHTHKSLNPRDRDIIVMRAVYGFTLEEVGMFYNITRERTRQLEARSLRRLRAGLTKTSFKRRRASLVS
jgi:RNA polymerase sigma factor (sigma-70 family)